MDGWIFSKSKYNKALKDYEASKQLIEVENAEKYSEIYLASIFLDGKFKDVNNNQLCTAEIKNNKAIIISLT